MTPALSSCPGLSHRAPRPDGGGKSLKGFSGIPDQECRRTLARVRAAGAGANLCNRDRKSLQGFSRIPDQECARTLGRVRLRRGQS